MTLGHPSTGMINAGTSVLQLIDSPALFRANVLNVLEQQLRRDCLVAIFFRFENIQNFTKISRGEFAGELLGFERRFVSRFRFERWFGG